MIPHRLLLPTVLLFSGLYFFKGAFAQDTLFYPSGEIQVVQLLSINKNSGLITYKSDGKTSVRAMSSLSSFTNHTNVPISEYQLPVQQKKTEVVSESSVASNKTQKINQASIRKINRTTLHGFPYGQFAFGVNLVSPMTALFGDVNFMRQRLFAQYNYNQHIGVRLPVAFGFSKDIGMVELAYRQIKYEIGLEPIFYVNDSMKSTVYFTLGAYTGQNTTAQILYNPTSNFIQRGPDHTYYRGEFNVGYQNNFSKHLVINFDAGFNINNLMVMYYAPYNDVRRFGVQARIHLVYRFGLKENNLY